MAVTARTVWLMVYPDEYPPFAEVLENDTALVGLFSGANLALFLEFVLFAGSLTLYQRERSGDLMPGWILWAMALALVFLAAGSLAAAIVSFVPIYRVWLLFDTLAAVALGVSMVGYPLAMRRLARRQPMTELELTVELLRDGQLEAEEQKAAISHAQIALAHVIMRLDSATTRVDSIAGDMESLALSLEAVAQREGKIYERITDARTNLTAASAAKRNGHTAGFGE